ncbi:DUF2194 domain-containing protein [Gracilimonas mengyeensis]|uniref:DUF2194 domain-containing protein n=1 Tax=Gracilimonas mengyeensis TaxID=1302730 RepID=A0A521AII5_9BACT|nr:DUF2194 domain-containing protein [Gracilimonas mengyeensis]SMO34593.1 hypothetical protein SAMN06265219_101170 [Gracilimonas mengyeensis]
MQKHLFFLVLSLAGFSLFWGCNSDKIRFFPGTVEGGQKPYVMVVKYLSDDYSSSMSANVTKSLDYTKIPYQTLDLEIISGEFRIPETVRTIVITSFEATQLPQEAIKKLIEFVAKGNNIVFTGPFADEKFSYLQGIRPDIDFSFDSTNTGFELLEQAFPGMAGKRYNPKGLEVHNGLEANQFIPSVTHLAATATDPEQPFIVSNKLGMGEVITINSYAINNRLYRGIVFSSILRGLSGIPYQVANVSTIFLDDFPAPLYNEMLPPIDEEYGISHAEFVSKVWWPDMRALADTFDITYSAMTAFNYNANVVPPFDFQEWRQGSIVYNQDIVRGSIFLANNIRDSRHELAFHGYNHFSLWREDWDNINFMISALHAARKRWQVDDMGPLPTNYVPPTNHIDSLGIQAIIRGMPSIEYMSSLYLGYLEDGGAREFDPEPYAPTELFNYPRITSGFTMTDNSILQQMGLQIMTGIWTHFVHPDDVFQVVQRDADDFASRNPKGLGWKSDPEYGYGLYHLLRERIILTQDLFPKNKFVSATQGGRLTQDWRRSLTGYEEKGNLVLVNSAFRSDYLPLAADSTRHWYMYATRGQVREIEKSLNLQELPFDKTPFWDGFLYQFTSQKPFFFMPSYQPDKVHNPTVLDEIAAQEWDEYVELFIEPPAQNIPDVIWQDNRMNEALAALEKNPGNRWRQEEVINLSIEFDRVYHAINILENRLLSQEEWSTEDSERLLTYYGWEGMLLEAEQFLESMWEKHHNQAVLDLKNKAVAQLGLYGTDFEQRWLERRLELYPDDPEILLDFTKSIESQENWPLMKKNLQHLLSQNSQSDTLYAFTLQRSLYYASPDSTLALVDRFPRPAYPQLMPFARELAQLNAYVAKDYEQALFWANNLPDFDERQKLYWLSLLELDELYVANAKRAVAEQPGDDSLRSYVGANLFYEGFQQEAYEVLYPLFQWNREKGLTADTLLRQEIGYMDYGQKKAFYKRYPLFFDTDQRQALANQHRITEGVKVTASGEYRDDNFDNTFARSSIGIEFGHRQHTTHTIKTENLLFTDDERTQSLNQEYYGIGYQLTHRENQQRLIMQAGGSLLFGQQDMITEALFSLGYSGTESYTSVQLSGGAELTSTSVQNDYYQGQLQLYRQDEWLSNKFTTSVSSMGKYYTNEVFEYGGQARLYGNLRDQKWRFRTLGELGYYDATETFESGIPYYTPDQYFSQGLGVDVQFRNPDNYEYQTRIDAEVMARHEREDSFYFSGSVQMNLKIARFWDLTTGAEISTSDTYRSNRIFITISHSLPTKFWQKNR